MPWKKYDFKGQAVYVRVLASGKPIVHRGRVELRYRLGTAKSYRASPENLVEAGGEIVSDEEMGGNARETTGANAVLRETPAAPPEDDAIIIYTDGACSGNPGPAGVGVLLQRPDEVLELSEFIGSGTNNIAELTAILRGLQHLRDDEADRQIHLYTDSGWSLGVLVQGWKAKTNLELIAEIKEVLGKFPRLEMLKIKGHAGLAGNEDADRLATMAVRRESSMTRTRKRNRVAEAQGDVE
ncbi:MAG: ribonuclease HI [Deltaproteobacteria bacterium]|jgi:ribonuclease HI|nr:ribonuclease HI [Deltaproteobacteria bacterium]MBK8241108.1 ribonuclease HI [Deltaproteobacteria bacterium]MBK8716971.1 ribonuclease HI [Deltaproteobacteria bacterium]MBP7292368.1 ribonuclease HI [Nannocystaceae bacterium]